MRQRRLGRSGLSVSEICLGTMTFGAQADEGESFRTLDRAAAAGVDFLDTADVYPVPMTLETVGRTEEILGRWLRGRRARFVLATKCFFPTGPGPNERGASRRHVIAACEASLRRLGCEWIDLYQLHAFDPQTPLEETLRALDDLVSSGKVRYLGVSDTPAWKVAEAQTIARFRGWSAFVGLQVEYSLAERTIEGELVPMARELGLGITPWSPLRYGVLSGKYKRETAKDAKPGRGAWVQASLNERVFALLDVLNKVAGELGTTPARVALAWVQARPGVTSTILGARSLAQLEDNLGALDLQLPAEARAALDEASKPSLNFPADFVRGSGMFKRGGSTVNGETVPPWPMAPKSDAERY